MKPTSPSPSRLRSRPLFVIASLAAVTLAVAAPGRLHAAEPVPTDNRPVIGLKYEGPIKVVYQITGADMKEGVNKGLFYLKKVHQLYMEAGVEPSRLDIKAVFHDDASPHVLTDGSWDKHQKTTGGNPNSAIIKELTALGIDIELCNTRRISMKWEKSDIHPDVILVSGAYPRITDLQLLGYAYIKL
jgi:intracellular sulfur oxidation DsrE/DsrF family protein